MEGIVCFIKKMYIMNECYSYYLNCIHVTSATSKVIDSQWTFAKCVIHSETIADVALLTN